MSGKGADAGLLVDHLQQGDGVSFFAAAEIPSVMNQMPFRTLGEGGCIKLLQGGCASAASRKATAHSVVKEQAYSKVRSGVTAFGLEDFEGVWSISLIIA